MLCVFYRSCVWYLNELDGLVAFSCQEMGLLRLEMTGLLLCRGTFSSLEWEGSCSFSIASRGSLEFLSWSLSLLFPGICLEFLEVLVHFLLVSCFRGYGRSNAVFVSSPLGSCVDQKRDGTQPELVSSWLWLEKASFSPNRKPKRKQKDEHSFQTGAKHKNLSFSSFFFNRLQMKMLILA